jgi:hypothetical protein
MTACKIDPCLSHNVCVSPARQDDTTACTIDVGLSHSVCHCVVVHACMLLLLCVEAGKSPSARVPAHSGLFALCEEADCAIDDDK